MAGRVVLVLLFAAGISACSLFHRTTPQQKLLDALNRGNGIQANEIWRSMSQKDRVKFNRGEGFKPAVSPEQVVKKLTEMSPDEMQGEITIKPPDAGASLLDLPKLAQPQSAPHAAPQPPAQSEDQSEPP
jgi:hypothetical protein